MGVLVQLFGVFARVSHGLRSVICGLDSGAFGETEVGEFGGAACRRHDVVRLRGWVTTACHLQQYTAADAV